VTPIIRLLISPFRDPNIDNANPRFVKIIVNQQQQYQRNANSSSQPSPAQTSCIYRITTANVLGGQLFCFERNISQSTLNGRNGSNACTFIAIIIAKTVTADPSLQFPNQTLSPVWRYFMTSCISKGNAIHHNVTGGQPTNFSVTEAAAHLSSLGTITTEESFDIDFTNQNPAIPQSSLSFYLQRLMTEPHSAAIVIINGLSICFVGRGNQLLLLDSHLHAPYGALIGKSTLGNIESFLVVCKQFLSPNFTMCTLTFVKFS